MEVFVCYSGRDDVAVNSLVHHLKAARRDVWLDKDLGGGEAWWEAILMHIRACTVFVFAVSDKSLQSKACRAEISYARDLRLPILPVQIGEVDSYRADPIFSTRLIDYRNPTATTAIELIGALQERAAQSQDLRDPLPEPPPLPYGYLMRLGTAISEPKLITYAEQMAILTELRQALSEEHEPGVRADIRRLLGSLRGRPDATGATITEIDAILERIESVDLPADLVDLIRQTLGDVVRLSLPEDEWPAVWASLHRVDAGVQAGNDNAVRSEVDYLLNVIRSAAVDRCETQLASVAGAQPYAGSRGGGRWAVWAFAAVAGAAFIAAAAYFLARPSHSGSAPHPAPGPSHPSQTALGGAGWLIAGFIAVVIILAAALIIGVFRRRRAKPSSPAPAPPFIPPPPSTTQAPRELVEFANRTVRSLGAYQRRLDGAGRPAGWFADPELRGIDRWWDGVQWTDRRRNTPD